MSFENLECSLYIGKLYVALSAAAARKRRRNFALQNEFFIVSPLFLVLWCVYIVPPRSSCSLWKCLSIQTSFNTWNTCLFSQFSHYNSFAMQMSIISLILAYFHHHLLVTYVPFSPTIPIEKRLDFPLCKTISCLW